MNLPTRYTSRKLWLNFHLVFALTAGFVFALVGLTGSIGVYRDEIDEWLNPQLVINSPSGDYQSLDTIMASVRAMHPGRHGEWTLEMPNSPHSMMTAWFEKPQETYFERYAPLMVSVNPYTAEIVASRFWGQTFSTWLLDLHTQLLMGERGWIIVGGCGLLLPFSIVSGLYLWWPGLNRLPSAIKIRLQSGLMLLLLDLHRLLGIIFAPALLLLAVTGINLSFPGWLESVAGSSGMTHGSTGKVITSTAIPNDHPTLLEVAEFIARGPFHDAEIRRITTPDGETGVYRVNLRQLFEINHRHPYTTVWVDRWSSQIKEVRNPAAFGFWEKIITWIWPLHTGEAVGNFGRLCWFMAGQSLVFLYISGVYRWLCRTGKMTDKAVSLSRWRLSFSSLLKLTAGYAFKWKNFLGRSGDTDLMNRILIRFRSLMLCAVTHISGRTVLRRSLLAMPAETSQNLLLYFQQLYGALSRLIKRCAAYLQLKLQTK